MNKMLKNIATVRFGTSVKKSKDGKIICFQVSDITEDGSLIWDTLTYTKGERVEDSEFLRTGDVLLPAKGSRFTAAVVSEDMLPAVASSSLFVLRVESENILPDYLQCFLNLSRIQWDLQKYATGTNIPSLSIRDLRKLKVAVPDLQTQKKVTELRNLQAKEETLVGKINELRKKLIEEVSKKMITKEMSQ